MKFPAFEPIDLKYNVDAVSLEELYVSQIFPNPNQPRKNFKESALQELALSIKQHGVIQPIIVQKQSDERYQIIAGERRWRASKLVGLSVIPAIIENNTVEKNIAVSLIENIQREALNPIELAKAFQKLGNDYNLSHETIASMAGKSRTVVTNLLRLLNLCPEIQILLISGKLEMGHARALLTLPKDQQILFAKKITDKHFTVRDVEKLVQLTKNPKKNKPAYSNEVKEWASKLSKILSSKVSVKINAEGEGSVVVHFSSPNEVDWLIERLSNKVEV